MDIFSSLYGSLFQPVQAGPTLAGAPASTPPPSSGGFLAGLSDLANRGITAYRNFTAPTSTDVARTQAQATAASYLPLILIGGGVLVVIVILALVFRRK